MKTFKNYISEKRSSNLEEIQKCISNALSKYDNWEVKDLNFLKNGKVIFSLDNYESGFEYIKHGVIWMAQDNLDEVRDKTEIGVVMASLPDSDWVVIKGVYDGEKWSRKYSKNAY